MSPIINIGPYFFGNFLWTYYFPADSLWTYYIFRDLSMKTLDLSWINFEFTTIFANKLWIHSVLHEKNFGFTISFRQSTFTTFNSIPFFANSLWILQLVCEFTSNLLCSSRIHHECLSRIESLPVHSFSTHYLFREFTFNSLSLSRNQQWFTISLAKSLMTD